VVEFSVLLECNRRARDSDAPERRAHRLESAQYRSVVLRAFNSRLSSEMACGYHGLAIVIWSDLIKALDTCTAPDRSQESRARKHNTETSFQAKFMSAQISDLLRIRVNPEARSTGRIAVGTNLTLSLEGILQSNRHSIRTYGNRRFFKSL
jgi:hypothetical protein